MEAARAAVRPVEWRQSTWVRIRGVMKSGKLSRPGKSPAGSDEHRANERQAPGSRFPCRRSLVGLLVPAGCQRGVRSRLLHELEGLLELRTGEDLVGVLFRGVHVGAQGIQCLLNRRVRLIGTVAARVRHGAPAALLLEGIELAHRL